MVGLQCIIFQRRNGFSAGHCDGDIVAHCEICFGSGDDLGAFLARGQCICAFLAVAQKRIHYIYTAPIIAPNCIISGIIRHGEIVIPRGITTLEEGDEILALVDDAARGQLEKILGRPEVVRSN